MSCTKHPKYKTRFAPTNKGCKVCWQMWILKCLAVKVDMVPVEAPKKRGRKPKAKPYKVKDKRRVQPSPYDWSRRPPLISFT